MVDDDSYTSRLIEGGYPGLILFVAGLGVLVGSLWRRRRLPFQPAVLAGLCAWLVAIATVDALVDDAALIATWLLLGVGAGIGLSRSNPAERAASSVTARSSLPERVP